MSNVHRRWELMKAEGILVPGPHLLLHKLCVCVCVCAHVHTNTHEQMHTHKHVYLHTQTNSREFAHKLNYHTDSTLLPY
jgi:hypothetical protein